MGRREQENRKRKVGARDYSEGLVRTYFDVSFYIVKLVFYKLIKTVVFDKCNIQILPCTLPLQFLMYCYFPKSTGQASSAPLHRKSWLRAWEPFLERPGNFSGPKSHFKNHEVFYVQSFLCQQVLHLSKAYTYAAFPGCCSVHNCSVHFV